MWLPSLYAVLIDLWRFLWPTNRTTAVLPAPAVRKLSRPPLIDVVPVVPADRPIQLQPDVIYTAKAPETIAIRNKLHSYDSHLVGVGNITLIEWLLYKIHLADGAISLLALAMSPVGRWHQTLKAQSGVRVSIEPTTGALMEWSGATAVGQAGIVTQVSPEQTITLQTVTHNPDGMYREQQLTLSQWKEFGPVFTRFRV